MPLNLVVPWEIHDIGLFNAGVPCPFRKSLFNYDISKFDGVTRRKLQTIATNHDGIPHTWNVLNAADAVVGTLVVPAGASAQLIESDVAGDFNPGASDGPYRMSFADTAAQAACILWATRILTCQTNATKTRIQPLALPRHLRQSRLR